MLYRVMTLSHPVRFR